MKMAIEGLKKHVGQLTNTGVRVAVVFRKLPNDVDSCLIVETERLPDSYHDTVLQCLNSREAFETNDFYEVLNRRTFPDGTNCLTSLHQRSFLRKEPVANVTMVPLPNQPVPLALINATIDKTLDQYKAPVAPTPVVDNRTNAEKLAAAEALAAKMAGVTEDPVAKAKTLISQAEVLEKDAEAKREEAYALSPELRPGRGRPPLPEDVMADKMEERKARRRERDRQKAEAKRTEKSEGAISSKVEAKLRRDEARANQE